MKFKILFELSDIGKLVGTEDAKENMKSNNKNF